jgi:hypothetical protein
LKKNSKDKKNDSKNEVELSKKNKKLPLVISIVIIICIIGVLWFILSPDVSASEEKAQIISISGNVQIKHDGTWEIAKNGTYLFFSDSVKTGDKSSATIILFKSSIVRLDSNTEITIKEIIEGEETSITIEQEAGRTWNTVSKISGIDNYEVQTPTTVASVRGTSFDVFILANGNISITVTNGTVNVTNYKDGKIVNSLEVPEYITISVDPKNIEKKPKPKPIEDDEWIEDNKEKDEEFIEYLKGEVYTRIEPFLQEVRDKFNGPNDEELEALIDAYVRGYYKLPDDAPVWAIKLFEII